MILSKIGKIAATNKGQNHLGNPIWRNLIEARPSNRMASSSFMAASFHAGSLQIWLESWLGVIFWICFGVISLGLS
jgi:hypothetical protein